MRLAAQQRGGFYPAHEKAVAHATTFLRAPRNQPFTMLDPCVGEGAAIRELGELLDCPPEMTYAIELDDSRAATLVTTLPGAHILAPASFFGCRASLSSFSAWGVGDFVTSLRSRSVTANMPSLLTQLADVGGCNSSSRT